MSRVSMETANCTACGKDFRFEKWDSYNVTLESSKEKVLSGDIFKHTCTHCGKTYNIVHNCLYHDMEKNMMVYLILEHEQREYMMPFNDEEMFSAESKYRLRLEREFNSFRERIRILDCGLDDKVFEVYKLLVLMQIRTSEPKADMLYFTGMEDNVFYFQVLSDETVITSMGTGSEYYESLLETLQKSPILKERNCFEVIDMQWALESGILDELERLS